MTPTEHYREAEKLLARAAEAAAQLDDRPASAVGTLVWRDLVCTVKTATSRAAVHAAPAAIPVPVGGRW